MNSKYRSDKAIELYVDVEELHFLAEAVTEMLPRIHWHRHFELRRRAINHLQELSMRIRANERLNSLEDWKP